jgi:thioredoxin-like negative regulator of GroEL
LFYSNECQHSANLLKKYKQLPKLINGCQFALININKPTNFSVVRLSQNTISPITFVPDVILYVDGIPFIRYDGPHEIQQIKQFILDIYQQLQMPVFSGNSVNRSQTNETKSAMQPLGNNRPISEHTQQQQRTVQGNHPPSSSNTAAAPQSKSSASTIPAYCIGKPKCGDERDNVSYLTFSSAYTKA